MDTTTAKTVTTVPCPACSGKRSLELQSCVLYECKRCGCLHGTLYLGESYAYVLPRMKASDHPERERPFDFKTLGSQGVGRRHGWYDPADRLVTQVG